MSNDENCSEVLLEKDQATFKLLKILCSGDNYIDTDNRQGRRIGFVRRTENISISGKKRKRRRSEVSRSEDRPLKVCTTVDNSIFHV